MNEKKELTYEFSEYFSQKNAQAIGTLLDDTFALYDPKLKWVRRKQAVVEV